MTPRIFLESGPLWAVGLAVARRCVLRLGFGEVFPNLYYLWVAPTTYYHKSTGLNAITDMVRDTVPHLLLPATTSPEMLVAKLAGERPANYEKLLPFEQRNEDLAARFAGQRGIIIDEASKMLIPKKYMEGHTETMMEMFDAPRRLERELRGDGKLIVYNPALALDWRDYACTAGALHHRQRVGRRVDGAFPLPDADRARDQVRSQRTGPGQSRFSSRPENATAAHLQRFPTSTR